MHAAVHKKHQTMLISSPPPRPSYHKSLLPPTPNPATNQLPNTNSQPMDHKHPPHPPPIKAMLTAHNALDPTAH